MDAPARDTSIPASCDPASSPLPPRVILSGGVVREASDSAVEGPCVAGSARKRQGILTRCDFSPVQNSRPHLSCLIVSSFPVSMLANCAHEIPETLEDPDPAVLRRSRSG